MPLSDHSSRSRSKAADGTATGPRVALMRSLRGWSSGVALKTARRLKDSSSTRLWEESDLVHWAMSHIAFGRGGWSISLTRTTWSLNHS